MDRIIRQTTSEIVLSKRPELIISLSGHPEKGQFVITDPIDSRDEDSFAKRIGFCVQVRKNTGAHHTDQVFLRLWNGSLSVHENQFFYSMTRRQEKLARSIFSVLPEQEDYEKAYGCDGIFLSGFLHVSEAK